MDDTTAIYYTCLNCGSKRIKITGEPQFADDNIVVCSDCGGFWTLADFQRSNADRISQMLQVDGKAN